eukprot:1182200-Prorocentrum_minimum.AAC.2
MARVIRPKAYPAYLHFLMEVQHLYSIHAPLEVLLVKKHFVHSNLTHTDEVRKHHMINGFGSVRHENSALEARFIENVRQGGTVIQVKVRDEQQVHRGEVELVVDHRQRVITRVRGMHSTIEHNGFPLERHVQARSANLLPGPQRCELHQVPDLFLTPTLRSLRHGP